MTETGDRLRDELDVVVEDLHGLSAMRPGGYFSERLREALELAHKLGERGEALPDG